MQTIHCAGLKELIEACRVPPPPEIYIWGANERQRLLGKYLELNDIKIVITDYNLSINLDKIKERAKSETVTLLIGLKRRHKDTIKMCKKKLCSAKNCPVYNIIRCYEFNNCNVIKNGKLYACPTIAHIEHFNEYFNQSFAVGDDDYIDIYKANNWAEVSEFLSRPSPFCKYCDIENLEYFEWEVSNRTIDEYI